MRRIKRGILWGFRWLTGWRIRGIRIDPGRSLIPAERLGVFGMRHEVAMLQCADCCSRFGDDGLFPRGFGEQYDPSALYSCPRCGFYRVRVLVADRSAQ